MRTAALIFVLLFASTASAAVTDGACAAVSHEACAHLDYADIGSPAATVAYDALFTSVPGIAPSMGYNTLPQALRAEFWVKFQEAVDNAGVLPVPAPADRPADPFAYTPGDDFGIGAKYTLAEAIDTYSSKVAHAFYLDINSVFPWKLVDIPAQHLDGLFKPQESLVAHHPNDTLFWAWDLGGLVDYPGYVASSRLIIDHSPADALAFVRTELADPFTGSQRAAVDLILVRFGKRLVHGNSGQLRGPPWPVTVAEMFSAPNESGTSCTTESECRYYSGGGCHTTSEFLAALLRAINIPARLSHGTLTGEGHATLTIPTIDGVLLHGDDVYDAGDFRDEGVERLFSYACWSSTSLDTVIAEPTCSPLPCDQATRDALFQLTQRKRTLKRMRWIAPIDIQGFCVLGWSEFRTSFDPYFDTCEEYRFTAWETNLIAETGCNGNPGQTPP